MMDNVERTIGDRINRLRDLLQSGSSNGPISARFTTVNGFLMLAVTDIKVDGTTFLVTTAEDYRREIVIPLTDIIEMVTFRDARGNPVFLHDFDSETGTVHDTDASARDYADSLFEEMNAIRESCVRAK